MRWTLIDSAVVTPLRLVHATARVPGSSSNLSLSLSCRAWAGRPALSRTMVVLTCSLMLSDIWTFLRPSAPAIHDTVLWHKVLGEGVVKLVLMFPMMFAIVLLEYVAWVFLYICWLLGLRNWAIGHKCSPSHKCSMIWALWKIKKYQSQAKCLWYVFDMWESDNCRCC